MSCLSWQRCGTQQPMGFGDTSIDCALEYVESARRVAGAA